VTTGITPFPPPPPALLPRSGCDCCAPDRACCELLLARDRPLPDGLVRLRALVCLELRWLLLREDPERPLRFFVPALRLFVPELLVAISPLLDVSPAPAQLPLRSSRYVSAANAPPASADAASAFTGDGLSPDKRSVATRFRNPWLSLFVTNPEVPGTLVRETVLSNRFDTRLGLANRCSGKDMNVMSGMLGTAGQQVFGREPGQALSAIRRLRKELELVEEAQVANALSHGWSWAQIGRSLGISRQAAHHKYSHCVPAALSNGGPALATHVRLALLLARTEAAARGDVLVGTEHLLLGLFQQGEGRAAAALREAGVGLRALRAAIDVLSPSDVCSIAPAQMSLTARGTRAFERAALQAGEEGSRRISDVHLLWAVLEAGSSGAVIALEAIGVDPPTVRRHLTQVNRKAPAILNR
jgi:hypothetical protein